MNSISRLKPGCVIVFMLFAISVAVMLIFWPGVSGGFLFDDYHNIVTNAHVQIKKLDSASLWNAANAYSGGTRQLAMLSFALNAYWAGLDPWAYKVTGLTIHAINSALVFLLVHCILGALFVKNAKRTLIALPVAIIWAVHPMQVSSALYIVQRMETLCYGFIFLALIFYIQARRQQIAVGRSNVSWWVGLSIALLASWLCKENAVLFPLYCLALELTIFNFRSSSVLVEKTWKYIYIVAFISAILVYIFYVIPHIYTVDPYAGRNFNTSQRLLTQCRVLVMYLYQIFLPIPENLYFYYDDLIISKGWLQPWTTLGSGVFLLGLFVTAIAWRQRYKMYALGVLWFFASHFLTSNVIGLELAFEHRNYFSILGVLLACSEIIIHIRTREGPGIKYFAVVVLVCGIAFLGILRAAMWGNVILLATDMVGKNPNSARAGMDMGVAYYELSGGDEVSPFFQFAATQFDRVSKLPNASTQADVNLILMYSGGNLPEDLVDLELVWKRYLNRLSILPLGVETTTSVWSLLNERMKGKSIDDMHLQRALSIIMIRESQPDYRLARLAKYYLTIVKDEVRAKQLYEQAIQLARKGGNEGLIEAIRGDAVSYGSAYLIAHLMLL